MKRVLTFPKDLRPSGVSLAHTVVSVFALRDDTPRDIRAMTMAVVLLYRTKCMYVHSERKVTLPFKLNTTSKYSLEQPEN